MWAKAHQVLVGVGSPISWYNCMPKNYGPR